MTGAAAGWGPALRPPTQSASSSSNVLSCRYRTGTDRETETFGGFGGGLHSKAQAGVWPVAHRCPAPALRGARPLRAAPLCRATHRISGTRTHGSLRSS